MSDDLAKRYEPILKERLEELEARLKRIEKSLETPGSKDDEERAIERENDEVKEDLGNAGLEEIRMIRAALGRIEADTFGDCVTCGEPIAKARLDVVPHAPQCRNCA